MNLYVAFIDLTKAFDMVNWGGIRKILGKLGYPPKFITIVHQPHKGQQGQIKHGGKLSYPFRTANGVKQRCTLAPIFFAIFFGMMLKEAKEELTSSGSEPKEESSISFSSPGQPRRSIRYSLLRNVHFWHRQRTLSKKWLTTLERLLCYSIRPAAWRGQRTFTKIPHTHCTIHPRWPSSVTDSTWWSSLHTLIISPPMMV